MPVLNDYQVLDVIVYHLVIIHNQNITHNYLGYILSFFKVNNYHVSTIQVSESRGTGINIVYIKHILFI